MKFDSQKAFPYPVLRPESDDFIDGEIQTISDIVHADQEGILKARIEFMISSSEIIKEIKEQRAVYFVVVACRSTYFRRSVKSTNKVIEIDLELKDLRDEVTIEPYIVAIKDIITFSSPDINTEFGQGPFQYNPGHILAQDQHQSFYIDRDVFKPITSVFDLVKNENLSGGEWSVSFNQDHVQIGVSPSMKERIDSARNDATKRAILVNSIYFATAMQAIQNLKAGQDFDEYRWAEVIRRKAHNTGIDLERCQAYEATQKLMKLPLSLLNTYVFKGD